MSILSRNVKEIQQREEEIFEQIGMIKKGYECYEPSLLYGGDAWYSAYYKSNPNEIYNDYQRLLNPPTIKTT